MQTNFNYHGGTEPRLQIQQVGTEPRITYHVDRENTPYPRPEAFDGVGTAMVKLACMDLEGELDELRQDALDAVTELNAAMVDLHVEGREDHDWYDLYMGTLSILDGVEKEVEQVRVGEADE